MFVRSLGNARGRASMLERDYYYSHLFTSSPTHSPTPTIINNEQSCGHAFPRFAHSQDEMGAAAITEALEAANMPTDVPTGLFVGECRGGGVGRTY